jgi:hypothetical protein
MVSPRDPAAAGAMRGTVDDGPADARIASSTALWFGVLGPAAIWFARLGVSYLVVPYACVHGATWWLHAVSAVTLAATAAAGLVAWSALRRARGAAPADRVAARTRFLARTGLLSAAFFAAVIIAEAILNFIVTRASPGGGGCGEGRLKFRMLNV